MPRLLPTAYIVLLAAGCSALPESARRNSFIESPLKRVAVNNRSIPLNTSSTDQVEPNNFNKTDHAKFAPWSPDELLVGTGVKQRIAQQQQTLAQRWEPVFATDQSTPWAMHDSEDTCRPAGENPIMSFAKLVPLPEPSAPPVAESTLQQCNLDATSRQSDSQAPATPPAALAVYTPVFQSVYVAATTIKENLSAEASETSEPAISTPLIADADSQIDQIITELKSLDRLRLNRVCLCQQVDGFGQLVEFPDANFAATEDVLIYCEVGNFKSIPEASPKGTLHRSSFSGSFVVTDLEGEVVAEQEYAAVDDLSQSQRDDFYLVFPAKIPDIVPGNYRLYLVVHDELGNDLTAHDQPIQFQVAFPNRIQN